MSQAPLARDLAKQGASETVPAEPVPAKSGTAEPSGSRFRNSRPGSSRLGISRSGRAIGAVRSLGRSRVTSPAVYDSDSAIRVGLTAREQIETRWGLILVIFMRLLAALWILQGLLQWSLFMTPRDAIFDRLSTGQVSSIIFFAVIDLLAAVGLWLATPWGGVLWLFAAASQIFVATSVRHVFATSWVAVDCVLILVYFALTWQASLVSQDRR